MRAKHVFVVRICGDMRFEIWKTTGIRDPGFGKAKMNSLSSGQCLKSPGLSLPVIPAKLVPAKAGSGNPASLHRARGKAGLLPTTDWLLFMSTAISL